jgi:hypothetical protein
MPSGVYGADLPLLRMQKATEFSWRIRFACAPPLTCGNPLHEARCRRLVLP